MYDDDRLETTGITKQMAGKQRKLGKGVKISYDGVEKERLTVS